MCLPSLSPSPDFYGVLFLDFLIVLLLSICPDFVSFVCLIAQSHSRSHLINRVGYHFIKAKSTCSEATGMVRFAPWEPGMWEETPVLCAGNIAARTLVIWTHRFWFPSSSVAPVISESYLTCSLAPLNYVFPTFICFDFSSKQSLVFIPWKNLGRRPVFTLSQASPQHGCPLCEEFPGSGRAWRCLLRERLWKLEIFPLRVFWPRTYCLSMSSGVGSTFPANGRMDKGPLQLCSGLFWSLLGEVLSLFIFIIQEWTK